MEIGGFFPFGKMQEKENGYFERVCPGAGDVRHLMSGRCAIYLCLQDSLLTDTRKTAYLPAYTCETVSGCFVKAGYQIYYYDVDETLTPLFDRSLIDKISFLLICGYYGFSTYDDSHCLFPFTGLPLCGLCGGQPAEMDGGNLRRPGF